MRAAWLVGGLLLGAVARGDVPAKGAERIVLHTVAGDLVLALYPQVAPRHVEQMLKLVRNGVLDTTHFRRHEKGFVLQLGDATDRVLPLNPVQQALLQPIPAEFSKLKHRFGTVSMARPTEDENGAVSSFSILLADAPHLDGKYTIFGELEWGAPVLKGLLEVPVTDKNVPKARLTVNYAEVVSDIPALLPKLVLKPQPIPLWNAPPGARWPQGLIWLVVVVGLSAAASWLPRYRRSLVLAILLTAGFGLFVMGVPQVSGRPWWSASLYLGVALLFRAMSSFELREPDGPPASGGVSGRTSARGE